MFTRSETSSTLAFIAPFVPDRVNNDLGVSEGGFVMPRTYTSRPVADRFWEKVEPAPNGCLIWTGCAQDSGHGTFGVRRSDGKWGTVRAYRWAFEQVCDIPEGLELDHICRDPRCVNWAHLEPVTHLENLERAPTSVFNVKRSQTSCKRCGGPLTPTGDVRRCRPCTNARYRQAYAAAGGWSPERKAQAKATRRIAMEIRREVLAEVADAVRRSAR